MMVMMTIWIRKVAVMMMKMKMVIIMVVMMVVAIVTVGSGEKLCCQGNH